MSQVTARPRLNPGLYTHGVMQTLGPGWQMIFDLRENTVCFAKPSGERVIMADTPTFLDDKLLLPIGCRQSLPTLALQIARLIGMTHGLTAHKVKERVFGLLVFIFEAP